MSGGGPGPREDKPPDAGPRPHCHHCGYDLRGVGPDARCPECGTAIGEGRPAAARPRPDLASADVPCLRCGYNLRGSSEDALCPECGVPVVRSLQGNLLEFSSPEHLASLHRGTVLIFCALLGQIVCTVGVIASGLAIGIAGAGSRLTPLLGVGIPLTMTGLSLLSLLGWWLFTAPDPAVLGGNTGSTSRRIVRIMVVVGVVTTVADAVFELSALTAPTPDMVMMVEAVSQAGVVAMPVAGDDWPRRSICRHVFDAMRLGGLTSIDRTSGCAPCERAGARSRRKSPPPSS